MENGLFLCKNMDSLRREGNTFFSGQIPLFTCFLHDYFRFKAQLLLPLKSSAFFIHSVVDYTIKYLQVSVSAGICRYLRNGCHGCRYPWEDISRIQVMIF